jgi:L-ribulose-5-phosphate 3-epimerase
MTLGRRHFLGISAAAAVKAGGQTRGGAPRARTGPVLCLDTHMLPEIDYSQYGTILNGLGFDGCDLAVEPGGPVAPERSPVDMVRSVEVITGDGLEVPLITTLFLSVVDPWARNVLALSGRSGVLFFRTGYSKYPERLAQRRNDIVGLANYGRAAKIGLTLPYPAAENIVSGLDPDWVGFDFDTSQGSVEAVLPRIRTILLRDVRKDADRMVPCPLGEGIVDWPAFFSALAHARFSGPLTVAVSYAASDRLEAIRRDLAFARKQLNAAYQKELKPI